MVFSPQDEVLASIEGTSNRKSLWLISAASQPMGIVRRFAYVSFGERGSVCHRDGGLVVLRGKVTP
jgi:hypothetical protein